MVRNSNENSSGNPFELSQYFVIWKNKKDKHYRGGVMKGLSKKWMAPFVIVYPTSALHDICRTAGTLKSFPRSG